MAKDLFKPLVPAESRMAEATPRAIALGLLLCILMAAANVYLGLYAGLTVSASIPTAVIAMGVFRALSKKGTLLENNIVQTLGSAGESLAAGVIFTLPALLITGIWTEIGFWTTSLLCLAGGLLGVVFMIPLRKSHIIEDKTLQYPEGVACAEVLEAGEKGGESAKYVLLSLGAAAVIKFFSGGVLFLKGSVESVFSLGRTGVFLGTDISPALLGVGYIVGLNIALVMALGGVFTWCLAIPTLGLVNGVEGDLMEWFWKMWSTQARFIGVGAMIVAGIASILNVRKVIASSFAEAFAGYRSRGKAVQVKRTDQVISSNHLLWIILFSTLVTAALYYSLIESISVSAIATVIALVMVFFFVAVASYIVGLVGASNSPVSGMTISAVLITGGVLLLVGVTGTQGVVATLAVACVVCCAICSSGDMSQHLKTGYLVGATPYRQQWLQIVGVVFASFVMAPVLNVLNESYGIGTGAPGSLKAPQANLFATLSKAFFGEGQPLPWDMVGLGVVIGLGILTLDSQLKARKLSFRIPLMAAAVGMYLPLTIAFPMVLGGLVRQWSPTQKESGAGVLFASGLVAGESIMGVVLGGVLYFSQRSLPIKVLESNLLSLAVLGLLTLWLARVANPRRQRA